MSEVIRQVRDIQASDRKALEQVFGLRLEEHQQIVIQVLDQAASSSQPAPSSPKLTPRAELPVWCDVYQGLSEAEIAEIETSIIRSTDSRSFP